VGGDGGDRWTDRQTDGWTKWGGSNDLLQIKNIQLMKVTLIFFWFMGEMGCSVGFDIFPCMPIYLTN